MKTTFLIAAIAVFGLVSGSAERVQMDQLPQDVKNTLRASRGEDVVKQIEKETKDGKTVYEVEFQSPGLNPKMRIAEDGQVIKDNRLGARERDRGNKTGELNKGLFFPRVSTLKINDLPEKVQVTAREQAAGRDIVDIDKETWNGQTVYEVEFAQAGRNGQVHINEQGTIVKYDDTKDIKGPKAKRLFGNYLGTQFEDTPTAVQETIRKEAQDGTISDIDKETRDGRVVYEVEIKQSPGRKYEIHVAENGTILRDSRLQEPAGAQIRDSLNDLSRPAEPQLDKDYPKDGTVK